MERLTLNFINLQRFNFLQIEWRNLYIEKNTKLKRQQMSTNLNYRNLIII